MVALLDRDPVTPRQARIGVSARLRRRDSAPLPKTGLEWLHTPVSSRVSAIREGLPAAAAKPLLAEIDLPIGALLQAIDVPPATFNRKVKQGETLAPDASERLIGLAMLVGQVEAMVTEAGDPTGFRAGRWLADWLCEPVPALAGQRPIDLLDTMEGQRLVGQNLARMQSGAYA
jgi:putative toxin-antitoxin system antitoxin component (TIGR02293 family)